MKIFVIVTAFESAKNPDSLTVIGGGVIGCEYASMFAALGSRGALLIKNEILPLLIKKSRGPEKISDQSGM